MSERWIVIPGWKKFQHYHDRDPFWVKDYLDQLDRDDYMELTFAQRGLLLDLRKLYARRRGVVRGDTTVLTRALTQKVTERQLEALNDGGWIEFSSSRPLALARARARSREKEEEKETPPTPPNGGAPGLGKKELRKYTGCRMTRGSHGFGYVRDPLGTDRPPADWPYERPSKEEVGAALAATSHGSGSPPHEKGA